MTAPQFHGRRASFSASRALEALGASLGTIREQDELTWKDAARVLGKSEDRAAAYANGMGDMGVVSFLLGCREWNGRFANDALALIGMKLVPLDSGDEVDRRTASCITRLLMELSVALEDGNVCDRELTAMRTVVDEAGRAIDAMRERLGKVTIDG